MIRKLYLILSITSSICSSHKHSFPSQRDRGKQGRALQVLTLATSLPDGWGVESRPGGAVALLSTGGRLP